MPKKIEYTEEELQLLEDKYSQLKEESKTNDSEELKREKQLLYYKIYFHKNKEKQKEVQLKYREQNREKLAKVSKDYYDENKDGKIQKYLDENDDKLKEYRKEYYLKNKESHLAKVKANKLKKKAKK